MEHKTSRQEQIEAQANQGWAKFILQPFNRILGDQRCGMKMDLMQNPDGEINGMVMILTVGDIPSFSISYENQNVKPDEPSGLLEKED